LYLQITKYWTKKHVSWWTTCPSFNVYRFCIFFRKIMNKSILNDLCNRLEPVKYKLRNNDDLYTVPRSRTLAGSRRISIFLPECINVIIRHSFKTFIIFNLGNFYGKLLDIKSKVKNFFRLHWWLISFLFVSIYWYFFNKNIPFCFSSLIYNLTYLFNFNKLFILPR